MRRLFWLAAGSTIGAVAMRKISRAAGRFTPSGVSSSLSASAGRALDSAREFARDVREGSAAREIELKESTGLDGQLGAKAEDFEKR